MVFHHIIFNARQNADVAQPVEQLIRNQQARGSIPRVGSSKINKIYIFFKRYLNHFGPH
jgi:hypothetical protein